ncbi:C-type lectin lectoxin-Phi1-like [Gouania willdenowi]|uniref:C-type lectin lectoxin-Phi1-like n=1 Tax=Gouania willdenowi TaxID=441366 RepID=UPI001055BAD9|nr:C-type lectin lectoxin-Phi1-like [Gouania willdenowi]
MARILLALMCLSGWSYSTCLQYHYVADQKTWTEAQTYCRQTYADLATIGNKEQNDQLLDTITSAGQSSEVWMGLYSTIDWRWSDGFSGVGANYRNWKRVEPNLYLAAEFCVLATPFWYDERCSSKWRFVCYNAYRLQLKITSGNSALDLNDPAVKKDLLKKLEERLKSKVERKVTLKWRNPQDGKVFKKLHTVVDSNDPEDCNGDYV